ncbi:terminal uridylyltransferase Tailor-like isoform X2 [Haematobia irritans]|uniref:terminal uridylyltransferase Tailor-like isoform X2 n=1 Tax=Haematobia irritans TaxID=7368 RepID=UPI003F500D85
MSNDNRGNTFNFEQFRDQHVNPNINKINTNRLPPLFAETHQRDIQVPPTQTFTYPNVYPTRYVGSPLVAPLGFHGSGLNVQFPINVPLNETRFTHPPQLGSSAKWLDCRPSIGRPYYNIVTGESVWEIPQSFHMSPNAVIPDRPLDNSSIAKKSSTPDIMKEQIYLHPITYEADSFAKTLEDLGTTYNVLDPNLIDSLENVIQTIEKFLGRCDTEVVATERTRFVTGNALKNIRRLYQCTACKKSLGIDPTSVSIHLTTECKETVNPKCVDRWQNQTVINTKTNHEPVSKIINNVPDEEGIREIFKQKNISDLVVKLNEDRFRFKYVYMGTTDVVLRLINERLQIDNQLKYLPDYTLIENDLLKIIEPLFPDQKVKIYKFGSRICGIGSNDSDLDIYVDIGENFQVYEHRASENTQLKLNKVQEALINQKDSWRTIVAVKTARVPILIATHIKTGISCDINFSNSLGYINTKFMEHIFTIQPVARVMSIYMKKWKNRVGIVERMINTYSINLMIIFYLQRQFLLPPLEKFFQKVNRENDLKVGRFFNFYSSFEYAKNIICPYYGVGIRRDKQNCVEPRYTSYIEEHPNCDIDLTKPIVLRDPFELNRNVTSGVSKYQLQAIKHFIVETAYYMNT